MVPAQDCSESDVEYSCSAAPTVFVLLILLLALGISAAAQSGGRRPMPLKLQTTSFHPGDKIPQRYTCDGEDISPELSWEGVPEKAQSLVLIMDDPDAPRGTFSHWVAYDIPAHVRHFPQNIGRVEHIHGGGTHGRNGFGKLGYGGPCPPPGKPHRYFLKLYALDVGLNLKPGASQSEVESAMWGHILAQDEIMGKYGR